MKALEKKYDFKVTEKKWQDYWSEKNIFKFDYNDNIENVYSIDSPPPHVSGLLHMGHVFGYTQMDVIARYQRMQGKNVFFPIGLDDNGLPSERYVEKKIGKKSKDMPRKDFVEICDKEIREAEVLIEELFKRSSYSFDFNEKYRTVSSKSSAISQMSFIDLYKKGLVYQKEEPVIWDVVDQTALAQSELEDKELESQMNYLVFDTDVEDKIEIMTTRPELLPACVAVMCHPDNYDRFRDKHAITPLGVTVPIIADDKVDKDKGTGFVMCCTFGDQTDIEWWKKHKLDLKIIISEIGRLTLENVRDIINPQYLELDGLTISKARDRILEILSKNNRITRPPEKIIHEVKVGERSKFPVEFLVKKQWFIDVLSNKDKLHKLVDEIIWKPEYMATRLHNWIDTLSWDWCVSRQRFFGIPIPVWYSKRKGEEGKVLLPNLVQLPIDPSYDLPEGYTKDEVVPDLDIFDTWATSAISPQLSSMGLNDNFCLDKNKYKYLQLPFDLRAQGHDIIRTWAFYTLVKADYHSSSIPWKTIMINGWCLDKNGQKMSKSLGNVIDPVKIFDQYGSDVIRYWASTSTLGQDTNFSEDVIKIGQKLVTKLFNASKFVQLHIENINSDLNTPYADVLEGLIFCDVDLWLLTKLSETIKAYEACFERYEYNKALETLEGFFWNDLCDNYLEIAKVRCYGAKASKYTEVDLDTKEEAKIIKKQQSGVRTIYYVLQAVLKLFAPFMPVICEEIYSSLYEGEFERYKSICARGNKPHIRDFIEDADARILGEEVLQILAFVRKYKAEKNLSIKTIFNKIKVYTNNNLYGVLDDLKNVCNVKEVEVIGSKDFNIVIEE